MLNEERVTPLAEKDATRANMEPIDRQDYTRIPAELKALPQWVCWRLKLKPGEAKPTKIPINPNTGRNAAVDKPQTWTDFETAVKCAHLYSGIGFVFTESDSFVGVDLDNAIDEAGELMPLARRIVDRLASYTELSQSGRGLHILCRGTLPGGGRKTGEGEMYEKLRYFAMTGNHVEGTSITCEERTEELAETYAALFPAKAVTSQAPKVQGVNLLKRRGNPLNDDDALLETARNAKKGHRFIALYDRGDLSEYADDESRADLALASTLLFYTRGDVGRAERLFSASALGKREKWQRQDYRERTFAAALEGMTEVYSPFGSARLQSEKRSPASLSSVNEEDLNPSLARFNQTDVGNAERFVARFRDCVRYCFTWGTWLVYDGTRWLVDNSGQVMELAKKTAKRILSEAAAVNEKDGELAQSLAEWSRKCESVIRLEAMLKAAKTDPALTVSNQALDANRFLLNVENGTLDLKTLTLRPHSPEDLITRLVSVPYDPTATCPLWLRFLEQVQPDSEVRGYLQRAVGYSLTGDIGEQCILFLHGHGANGKSVFLEVVSALLQEFHAQANAETFMQTNNLKDGSSASPDLARLEGRRFVTVAELNSNQRFNEALIKGFTGKDIVTSRLLYGQPFEYVPQAKLWFAGNHKPYLSNSDEGIQRRIRLLKFGVTIPKEQRDKNLPETLKRELTGILAWASAGCQEWQRTGLGEPLAISEATGEYLREQDTLGAFFEEQCILHPSAEVTKTALWKAYDAWAKMTGEQAFKNTYTFGSAMKKRPEIDERRTGKGHYWLGIRLREEEEESQVSESGPTETEPPAQTESAEGEASSEPETPKEEEATATEASPVSPLAEKQVVASPPVVLYAPAELCQKAKEAGRQRTEGHRHTYKAGQGLDPAKASIADYWGVLAELLVMEGLERAGYDPQGFVLVTDKPTKDPDFTLDGVRFDVKSCQPYHQYVTINEGKRKPEEKQTASIPPDHYVIVTFETETTARLALVAGAEVEKWECREGHSEYRSINKSQLSKVTDWKEFGELINYEDTLEETENPFDESDPLDEDADCKDREEENLYV